MGLLEVMNEEILEELILWFVVYYVALLFFEYLVTIYQKIEFLMQIKYELTSRVSFVTY